MTDLRTLVAEELAVAVDPRVAAVGGEHGSARAGDRGGGARGADPAGRCWTAEAREAARLVAPGVHADLFRGASRRTARPASVGGRRRPRTLRALHRAGDGGDR